MNRFIGKFFAIFLGVVILGLALLLQMLPAGGASGGRESLSRDEEGRLAAYLLLRELGFAVERWTDTPGRLPTGPHLLLLPDAPPGPPWAVPTDDEGGPRPTPPRSPQLSRQRDPLHYLRFMEEGGTILSSLEEERKRFLVTQLDLTDLEDLKIELVAPPDGDSLPCVLYTGESVDISYILQSRFTAGTLPPDYEVLLSDEEGRAVIVRRPVGRGSLVLVGHDACFGYGWIADHDHALLLVRLAELLASEERVLFDDYALGAWRPDSPLELALASGRFVVTGHVALLVLLAVLALAWTFAFPRDPEPLSQQSPLARVRGYAGTLARLGRWDLASRLLREGVLRRLARRVGVRLPRRDGPAARLDPQEIDLVLEPLDVRLPDASARARARNLFLDPDATGAKDLERLGAELARIEAILTPAGSTSRTKQPWKRTRKS